MVAGNYAPSFKDHLQPSLHRQTSITQNILIQKAKIITIWWHLRPHNQHDIQLNLLALDQTHHLDMKNTQWLKATTPITITIITRNDKWLPTTGIIAYYCYYFERSEQVFCCNHKCVKHMCIGIDPCTRAHCCAFLCNAHYVGVVNQKTVQSQCNSGRLLIAFWRICCIIFVFLFLFCVYLSMPLLVIYYLSACISFCSCISLLFEWMQSFADCSIRFDVDIHLKLIHKYRNILLMIGWFFIFW